MFGIIKTKFRKMKRTVLVALLLTYAAAVPLKEPGQINFDEPRIRLKFW